MKVELTDKDIEELSSELENVKKLRKSYLIKGSVILIVTVLLYSFIGDILSIGVVMLLGLWFLIEWFYHQSKNVEKLATDLANNEKIILTMRIQEVVNSKQEVYLENKLCFDLWKFKSSLSRVEEGVLVEIKFLPISMSVLNVRERKITPANNS